MAPVLPPPTDPGGEATLDGSTPGSLETLSTRGAGASGSGALPPGPGEMIGSFVVQSTLGAGAMGVVLLAHDRELDRPVAIKLLSPTYGEDDRAGQRLLREAQSIAKLSDPHVVAVHAAGMHGARVYVVMEYVDGGTLRQWVTAGPRTWRQILDAYRQAGQGLMAAHAAGLVHRDFKPDNVLIGRDGRVRVSDFGLVAGAGSSSDTSLVGTQESLGDLRLTQTGAVLGTPAYMAPEQLAARVVDARADQFAFCVALYEALHGQRPFEGDNLVALYASIESGRVRPPVRADVPSAVHAAITRGLATDPARRHPSMAALLSALGRATGHRPGASRGLVAGIVAGSVLLAGGAVAAAIAWSSPGDADTSEAADPAALQGEDPVVAADADACPRPDGTLEGRWVSGAFETLDAAFVASGLPSAADRAGRARLAIDGYVDALAGEQQAACRASGPEGAPADPDLLDARARCLHDVEGDLIAVLELFEGTPSRAVVDSAFAIVRALEPPSICSDEAFVRARPEPAGDSDRASRWQRLRRAEAHILVSEPAVALEDATALVQAAAATGDDQLSAASLVTRAKARRAAGDLRGADSDLVAAIEHAQAAPDPLLELRARRERVVVIATMPGRAADAKGLLPGLQQARERAAAPHEDWILHAVLTELHAANGELADALGELEAAIVGLQRLALPRPDQLGLAHVHRGTILRMLGRVSEAEAEYKTGIGIQARALGVDHASQAFGLEALVALLGELGRTEEVLQHASRLVVLRRGSGEDGPPLAHALQLLGNAELSRGRLAEAAAVYEEARAIYARSLDTVAEEATVGLALGQARFLLGDSETAERVLARAAALAKKTSVVDTVGGPIATLRGSIAATRGDYATARPFYEAGLEARKRLYGTGAEVIDAHLAIAELDVARGACGAAAEHIEVAAEIQGSAATRRSDFLVRTAVAQAQCAIEAGELAAAGRSLDEADAQLAHGHLDPLLVSNVRLVRAKLAFRGGDRERAVELATKARDELAALGPDYAAAMRTAETFIETYAAP